MFAQRDRVPLDACYGLLDDSTQNGSERKRVGPQFAQLSLRVAAMDPREHPLQPSPLQARCHHPASARLIVLVGWCRPQCWICSPVHAGRTV